MAYTPEELSEILDFILDENSDIRKVPPILGQHTHFRRIMEILMIAKGYKPPKYSNLTILADNVELLRDEIVPAKGKKLADRVTDIENGLFSKKGNSFENRITAIEKLILRPPEAKTKPKDITNTTLANKHHR